MTTLLNVPAEKPDKSRAMIFTVVALLSVAVLGLYFAVRYYPEKHATETFFNALVAGDTAKAYEIWKPSASYQMKDFLADWGPNGYYGPVKSFNVRGTYRPPDGPSGVVIIVDVSPYQPFPEKDDALKQSKSKEVRLWVQFKDHSVEFPPPQYEQQ